MKFQEGPKAEVSWLSGVFAIMGAREFGRYKTIQSRSGDWIGDLINRLNNALSGRRLKSPAPLTPDSAGLPHRLSLERESSNVDRVETPTRRGKTPGGTKGGRGRTRDGRFTDESNNLVRFMAPRPIVPKPAISDTHSAPKPPQRSSTQSSGDSTEVIPVSNSKRRSSEQADPMAFDVKEMLNQYNASIARLGVPQVTALHQKTEKCRTDHGEHSKTVKRKKEDLSKSYSERASRAEEHGKLEEEWKTLGAEIAQDEKAYLEDYIPRIPATPQLSLLEAKPLQELGKEDFEAKIKPFREKYERIGAQKRKASEMLQAANQACSALKKEVGEAEKEGKVIAKKMRMAYKREELAAMLERQAREREAFRAQLGEDY
ncbi:hypothetical protein IL306_013373 [Fusarium sp. DS 682]|nr:hypothetical protein IL306_013373 [Fusarium sp. DS 682]